MDKGKFITLLSILLFSGISSSIQDEKLQSKYLLPRNIVPKFYDVRLYLDPNNKENFYGNVSIRIICHKNTNEIAVHAEGMNITDVQVFDEKNVEEDLFEEFSLATDDTHLLKIKLKRQIDVTQPHIVHIDYIGKYHDLYGIYRSSYVHPDGSTRNLISSQFSPIYARRALPCFDEPAMKSVFRTTIYAPENFPTVLSNMPERTDLLKKDVSGYKKHEFQDTPMMSTYILAYFVSDFGYVENSQKQIYRVPFRIYSQPDTSQFTSFSLNFAQEDMVVLENYTDYTYPLPKFDNIALVHFGFNAMENWGLTVYRDTALLVEEGVTTSSRKFTISTIIGHENAHLWFGNQVSPSSWTFAWLKEGFATFFANFASELINADYRFIDASVIQMQNTFVKDSKQNVPSMSQEAYTPSQILDKYKKFSVITYRKAAAIIRMVHHFITPQVFQNAMRKFIKKNAGHAVLPPFLYDALQEALDESKHSIPYPVATVFDSWAKQPGFPVLTIRRTDPTENSVVITQERFLYNTTISTSERWIIPINWVLSSNADFSDTRSKSWIPAASPAPSIDIAGLSDAKWFLINTQQTGFYRVNYDVDNWRDLAAVLNTSHEIIHVLNRAQLIDDSYNLARGGRLEYTYALAISRYLTQETDFIPWSAAEEAFEFIKNMLRNTQSYKLFQQYLLYLTTPLYNRLGFEAPANENYGSAKLRTIILALSCNNGNHNCWETANTMVHQLKNDSGKLLNPDIKDIVYCSSLRSGDAENYNFFWDQLFKTRDRTQRDVLLRALGCTSNSSLLNDYLKKAIEKKSTLSDSERLTMFETATTSSSEGLYATWQFFLTNFKAINERQSRSRENFDRIKLHDSSIPSLDTPAIFGYFVQRLPISQQSEFERFVENYKSDFTDGDMSAIKEIRESLVESLEWVANYQDSFKSWLEDNLGGKANCETVEKQ